MGIGLDGTSNIRWEAEKKKTPNGRRKSKNGNGRARCLDFLLAVLMPTTTLPPPPKPPLFPSDDTKHERWSRSQPCRLGWNAIATNDDPMTAAPKTPNTGEITRRTKDEGAESKLFLLMTNQAAPAFYHTRRGRSVLHVLRPTLCLWRVH
jgi:hypothetical protein